MLAAHVRATHVHAVVHGLTSPERIMTDFKAYASRRLSGPRGQRWARHGSTLYLWKTEEVELAIRYTVDEQGEPMAVSENQGGLEGRV